MTISDTTPRVQYTVGSGGQTAFTVSFQFFAVTDLAVYNGTTKLTYAASPSGATQYSVAGAGASSGGTVTLGAAVASTTVTIVRDVPVARSTDFPPSGPFQIGSLNDELDKFTAMIKEREDDIGRSVAAPDTDPTSIDMTLPVKADRLGKLLGFDSSTGNPEATTGRILSVSASDVAAGGSATVSYNDATGALALGIPTGATGATGAGIDVLTTRGDIVVRNASNATARLAAGSANTVLKSDGSDVAYGQVATAMIADDAVSLAKMASGTDGNLISYDTSGNPVAVATGSSGQVLTSNGAGAAPTFQTASGGGGKVLQVVTAATSTEATTTSGTYADTNLTADITPANTANKILVLVSQSISSTGGRAGGALRIVRGSTEIEEYNQISNAENQMSQHFIQHLDSPSSTSSTTYHTEFKRIDQSGTIAAQRNDSSGKRHLNHHSHRAGLFLMARRSEALASLAPDAEWSISANGLRWDSPDIPQPSDAEIEAEMVRLDSAYAANEYARNRAAAYPAIADQLDMQYWDQINGTTIWADTIAAVKAAHPKP